MDLGIKGRVAMVAAASKGIGLAAAKRLAAEGCQVSICARNQASLDQALKQIGGEAMATVADVTQPADLETWHRKTVGRWGAVSILITNTGGPPAGELSAMTDDQWQSGFDSTVMNVIRLMRLVTPSMKDQKWGRIVHVTSVVASEPSAMLPISSTLRAGLVATTKLQAKELAPFGITVNGVLPGHTLTDRQTHLAEITAEKLGITADEALERQSTLIPTGRLATADEIAAPIAFLCGEPAAYINGISLLVDGALTKGI